MNHTPSRSVRTAFVGALIFTAATATAPARAAGDDAAARVARGEYIVKTAACMDCHTPHRMGPNGPDLDMARMLSGHPETLTMPPAPTLPPGPWGVVSSFSTTAWSGPWGTSFTANLTPDVETGLGAWTARDFVQTIRTGRHMGRGRPILPPMPWRIYRNFDDADLEAIFAYLRSIPPVKNRVPEPIPPAAAAASGVAR